ILRLTSRSAGSPLLKAVIGGAFEGVVVTDGEGRGVYANRAYLDLIYATGPHDGRPPARGKRVPGVPAPNRLSRPRPGRLLPRRRQGRGGLPQCHARQLA